MASIPGLPNPASLPLDKPISLGGLSVHSHWLGGYSEFDGPSSSFNFNRYGFGFKDWWLYKAGVELDYEPDSFYVCAPDDAVDVRSFFTTLNTGWKLYSPFGMQGRDRTGLPMSLSTASDPNDVLTVAAPALTFDPYMQHFVMAKVTNTTTPDGFAPIYDGGDSLSIDHITAQHWNTVLVVLDGTGSFGGGTDADDHLHELFAALAATGSGGARVIATKFSDYPDPSEDTTDPDDIPALLLGTWNATSSATADYIITASDLHFTGSGGDVNESQFEAIQLGFTTAREKNWDQGNLCIVVYTDAASVVAFANPSQSPMRLTQRDDGLAPAGHARFNGPGLMAGGRPTSQQNAHAPRQPQTPSTYQ